MHLHRAKLTVSLAKSEFGQAQLTFLGHVVGQGQVKKLVPKSVPFLNFQDQNIRGNDNAFSCFLGMAGYYRKFCPNFSHVAETLTNLLKKTVTFVWSAQCEKTFQGLKGLLQKCICFVSSRL